MYRNDLIKDIIFEKLQKELENQIQYKKNKEFLYVNCNRIKRRFYHYRTKDAVPVITICTLYDLKEKVTCRGISICSLVDMVNKEIGRNYAENRAIKAHLSKETTQQIFGDHGDIRKIFKRNDYQFLNEISVQFKSAYNVEMTDFEKRLFKTFL
jgi:hypothetical protein